MRGSQADRQDVALLATAQELARDYRLTGPDTRQRRIRAGVSH